MILQAKGYLPLLLLLLLLPSYVVSRNPKQRPVNEASTSLTTTISKSAPIRTTSLKSEKREGLMINSWSLIARPENKSIAGTASVDYNAKKLQPIRRLRRTFRPDDFVVSGRLHQQSTNSAAAKRDLHYKQRPARGTAPSTSTDTQLISGDIDNIHDKRRQGRFLPGQVNGLTSNSDEDEESELYEKRERSKFQAPKLVYVDKVLPEPFVKSEHRQRGRIFGLTNFLIKGRPPTEPRSFMLKTTAATKNREKIASNKKLMNNTEILSITAESPTMIVNDARVEDNQGYALYHRIIDDELEEDSSAKIRSFEANSVVDDSVNLAPTEKDLVDEDDQPDWDASETRSREVVEDDESDNRQNSRYEFGYRVIDRKAASDFGHEESRHGRETSGRYHVLLPDGRVQHVEYFVDRAGYHADVTYAKRNKANHQDTEDQSQQR